MTEQIPDHAKVNRVRYVRADGTVKIYTYEKHITATERCRSALRKGPLMRLYRTGKNRNIRQYSWMAETGERFGHATVKRLLAEGFAVSNGELTRIKKR